MGQCSVAWNAYKNRKVDAALSEMKVSVDKRHTACVTQEQKYAGKTLEMEDVIAKLKSVRAKKPLTRTQKDDAKKAIKKRVIYNKRTEKWAAMASAADEAKENLEELAVNKESLEDAKIMAKGMEIMKAMGMGLSNAEGHLDKAIDAKDSMDEFNRAFAERDQDQTVLTPEELEEIEAELESEFGNGTALKDMPAVPTKQHSNYVKLDESSAVANRPEEELKGNDAEAIELGIANELENDA